jgi:hypothetical protein
MKKPPEPAAAEAGDRRPDYVIELWRNPQLDERTPDLNTSRTGIWQAGPAIAPEADPEPRLADREGRAVTTVVSNITKDMTPAEAANLLTKLEHGNQAAWLSTREMSWQDPEYEARFQNAAEIDSVVRDIMQETIDNGMRRPSEPVDEFAERAGSGAWFAGAREPGAETTTVDAITPQAEAGMTPQVAGRSQDEIAARLWNDPSTPEGHGYARAFSDAAAARAKELRESDPLPEPDRTPDAPHPDPFLASRGWHVSERGIYTRRAQPEPQAPPERDLEAGA